MTWQKTSMGLTRAHTCNRAKARNTSPELQNHSAWFDSLEMHREPNS